MLQYINIALGSLLVIGILWYQSNKIDNLIETNTELNNQLLTTIQTNKELTSTIEAIDNNYTKQLEVLNTTTIKKDTNSQEIDKLKRKVSDDENSAINTARDILNRMHQQATNNN